MKISLIICSRNRAGQLKKCLEKLSQADSPDLAVEVIVIDNGSEDHTAAVIQSFVESRKWLTKTCRAERKGLGFARNCGINLSSGDLLVFIDDDCYLEKNYFQNLQDNFNPEICQYGAGQILLYDPDDDGRVANLKIAERTLIPSKSAVIPAGTVQGANMFFLRKVFDAAGLFNENMGTGTAFPCEDIEMASRASHHGFTGAQLPGFTVYHHHGCKKNSPEAEERVASYDYGRGAYYASLLSRGILQSWDFWGQTYSKDGEICSVNHLSRLSRELLGASQYFDLLLEDSQFQIPKNEIKT